MLVREWVDKKEFERLRKLINVEPKRDHVFPVTDHITIQIGKHVWVDIVYEDPDQQPQSLNSSSSSI